MSVGEASSQGDLGEALLDGRFARGESLLCTEHPPGMAAPSGQVVIRIAKRGHSALHLAGSVHDLAACIANASARGPAVISLGSGLQAAPPRLERVRGPGSQNIQLLTRGLHGPAVGSSRPSGLLTVTDDVRTHRWRSFLQLCVPKVEIARERYLEAPHRGPLVDADATGERHQRIGRKGAIVLVVARGKPVVRPRLANRRAGQ